MPRARAPFTAGRLWLEFVNTDEAPRHAQPDALVSFDGYLAWLESVGLLDGTRRAALQRRAVEQPASATATLHEARRIRGALRPLAERGKNAADIRIVMDALEMIHRGTSVTHIMLVSGDGDFTELVHRLRAEGKTVIGMGVSGTSAEYLVNACDEFIY